MNTRQENITKIPEIILKKISREATNEELQLLDDWLSESEQNRALYQKLLSRKNLALMEKEYQKIDNDAAWEKILDKIETKKKTPVRQLFGKALKYAAILAIPLAVASYLLISNFSEEDSSLTFAEMEKQISELKESSLITDEGEVVLLQSEKNESIVEVDGTQIHHKDSTLLYDKEEKKIEEVKYNSLVTPRSKVYNLVLADGTKVWLNASSAIKYPVSFVGDIRKVYLTGEAYFEVTHNAKKTFIVSTNEMDIEVLGTSFNVMAYPEDQTVETTLVSGKVKVRTDNSKMLLEPGTQAKLDKETRLLDKNETNTDLFTSWRFGKYIFEYENLEGVMSKLSRWYDVDVTFADAKKKDLHFSGTLFKYNDINETLHIIELTSNVRFENTENSITVN
ncbi:FecR domain-containing protein [uncultured Draconibacterium sp.]|uniref:FecR family protein n=1 Tax=uncultured Draconibacterium sp. TaxID=1573823 RepID=UPI002AA6EFD8|nr:FecR domain-containing protein [uncultured Draconibacterium sp.]